MEPTAQARPIIDHSLIPDHVRRDIGLAAYQGTQQFMKWLKENDIRCEVTVDGYTDFIFVNRFGATQHQGTLNKAIRRIIRDCNDEVLLKGEKNPVLLPHFSCHSLRHTFTTRMCEAGVNVKVIQDALGHTDISTTLNIYADVTRELRKSEFEELECVSKCIISRTMQEEYGCKRDGRRQGSGKRVYQSV